jgi:tetratricopeptide (TPR) repeat protein
MCGVPVCEPCLGYIGTEPRCPACTARGRRARRLRQAALVGGALAVIAVVVGIAGWVVTRDKPYDYGVRKAEVRALDELVDDKPCDRNAVFKLVDTVFRLGDDEGALRRANAHLARCGDWPRLRWITYSAYHHLGRWDEAIAEATRLIESSPRDQDFYWWRGQSEHKKRDLDGAIADFRKALEIMPHAHYIPFDLARALEDKKQPCLARDALVAYVAAHPEARKNVFVVERIASLHLAGACPGPMPAPSSSSSSSSDDDDDDDDDDGDDETDTDDDTR